MENTVSPLERPVDGAVVGQISFHNLKSRIPLVVR